MECKLVEEAPSTYTKQFETVLPYYLTIGMTVEQFWEGESTLPIFFRQAAREKAEADRERENYLAWLNGRYVLEAIAACFAKNHHYPDEPLGEREYREQKRLDNMTLDERMAEQAENFSRLVDAMNKKRKDGESK